MELTTNERALMLTCVECRIHSVQKSIRYLREHIKLQETNIEWICVQHRLVAIVDTLSALRKIRAKL